MKQADKPFDTNSITQVHPVFFFNFSEMKKLHDDLSDYRNIEEKLNSTGKLVLFNKMVIIYQIIENQDLYYVEIV